VKCGSEQPGVTLAQDRVTIAEIAPASLVDMPAAASPGGASEVDPAARSHRLAAVLALVFNDMIN
jgi:hypothetical protein